MDAGVPLVRPVAGISIGLCTEHDANDKITQYKLLTDIIGWEDAFCDMDCKIAGTEKGITGFQLDLKLRGCPAQLMTEAVEKARVARLFILGEMAKTLAAPRKEISKYAPRIETIKINPEKIGAIIGPGGKNIKKLVEESGCEIDIEDDGTVNIFSVSPEGMKIARDSIMGMTAEAEPGKIYRGKVVTIKEFGCLWNSCPARTAWFTSANWPISASKIPRTSSRWATKSWSNALAWTKKAASAFRAKPPWKNATRKWLGKKRRRNQQHHQPQTKILNIGRAGSPSRPRRVRRTRPTFQSRFANSARLFASTSLCSELPCASIVTTAGKSSTSNSQIASGAPNWSII